MINLDNIIGRMRNGNCTDCNCEVATSDINSQDVSIGQKVKIHGSFCNVISGYDHIAIIATDANSGKQVWSKVCDTGHMCSIPFTSGEGFDCDD